MKDSGKILVGAMAGLAAGLVLGILFAPDKGSNTRKKITDSTKDLSDKLKSKLSDTLDYISDLQDEAAYAADELNGEMRAHKNKGKDKV